jgi:hypothetical protein
MSVCDAELCTGFVHWIEGDDNSSQAPELGDIPQGR